MTLPVYAWPNFLVQTQYPDNSYRPTLGGSYQFATKPTAPPQRIFTLTYAAMVYYLNPDGFLNPAIDPDNNLWGLEVFYRGVQTYGNFTFNHPAYGPLICKFSTPLLIPAGQPDGGGSVLNVVVTLVEQLL